MGAKMSDCTSPLGTVCKDPACPLHFPHGGTRIYDNTGAVVKIIPDLPVAPIDCESTFRTGKRHEYRCSGTYGHAKNHAYTTFTGDHVFWKDDDDLGYVSTKDSKGVHLTTIRRWTPTSDRPVTRAPKRSEAAKIMFGDN